jgi:hypothetical protein
MNLFTWPSKVVLHSERIPRKELDGAQQKSRSAGLQGALIRNFLRNHQSIAGVK